MLNYKQSNLWVAEKKKKRKKKLNNEVFFLANMPFDQNLYAPLAGFYCIEETEVRDNKEYRTL